MGKVKLGTSNLLDEAILKRAQVQAPRNYLGASMLGEECDRKLWYSWHEPKPVSDARTQRIFDIGHKLEELVISWLKETGLTVHTEEGGEQFGFVDGVIAGHIDGVVVGLPESKEPHLLEIKTYNDSRFSDLCKGCVLTSDPKYYTQMCVYMEKMGLNHSLFVAVNKDNADIYVERIHSDPIEANAMINRGKQLTEEKEVKNVERKFNHKSFFKCKWCDYRAECWERDV